MAGTEALTRRFPSRFVGESAERSPLKDGTLPLLLAGLLCVLLPRLTGETRLRLVRLGNEPEAGGDDCVGGDWPVGGTDGRLREPGFDPAVGWRSGGRSGDEMSSGIPARPGSGGNHDPDCDDEVGSCGLCQLARQRRARFRPCSYPSTTSLRPSEPLTSTLVRSPWAPSASEIHRPSDVCQRQLSLPLVATRRHSMSSTSSLATQRSYHRTRFAHLPKSAVLFPGQSPAVPLQPLS